MAFKPDRPLGYYDMCHLNPDTKRFATLLREGPPTDGDIDWQKGLSPEEITILDEEAKKKKSERKIKPCVVKECKQTEHDVQMATLERIVLIKKIKEVEDAAIASEEEINELEKAAADLDVEGEEATKEIAILKLKEKKELKERMTSATRLKSQLELEILKANAVLSSHKEAAAVEAASAAKEAQQSQNMHSSTLPIVNFIREYVPPNGQKHTGIYRTIVTGNKQWSCCMADDEDHEGCADDHSVGVKSTLVHKHESAHHPYTTRLAEHVAADAEKAARLHEPSSVPPTMNKGFRDVRASHENFSYYSRNHGGHASALDVANHAKDFLKSLRHQKKHDKHENHESSVISHNSAKSARIGEGSKMGGSADSTESRQGNLNTARTSLVFYESSLARTNVFLEKRRAGKSDRPSTAGAFPLTGSMRVSQKRVTSGPYPVFANTDMSLEYNPAKDKGMARSDVRNVKIDPILQCLDSASLLANYSKSVNMSDVGQKRHLGLAQMRRVGGRPLTATIGPHLKTTSTTGVASSFAHYCQKQC